LVALLFLSMDLSGTIILKPLIHANNLFLNSSKRFFPRIALISTDICLFEFRSQEAGGFPFLNLLSQRRGEAEINLLISLE